MNTYPYPYPPSPIRMPGDGSFTQGFVASACISAFQDVARPGSKADYQRIVRHGLQGGAALAAGSHAARALHRNDYTGALLSIAAGAAGVLLVEHLLREHTGKDKTLGDQQ